ncbi:MAG: hypothetical protein N3J91_05585 [Verrucomicrobiae bacterium]|nr:hypothetical protein [Verrucomicrobiae bacterium]
MTLEQAIPLIKAACQRMNQEFGEVLFDEWAVVRAMRGKLYLEHYEGPRREEFIRQFHAETADLKSASMAYNRGHYEVGDFEFTPDGVGSKADAFLKLGPDTYLVFGNTRLSMAEITRNKRWLKAQGQFASLSERVIHDPLALTGAPQGPEL